MPDSARSAPRLVILAAALCCAPAAFAEPAPEWYLQEIARLTAGGGRWEADNAAYRSDDEPYESYVTEWTSSFDGITLRGRLYGVTGGKATADFRGFRMFWHPDRDTHVTQSFAIEDGEWLPQREYTWHRKVPTNE